MDLFELWGTIGIRTSEAFDQINQVQDSVNNLADNMGTTLQNAGKKMSAVGDGVAKVGTGMTTGVTAPLVAIGLAAGKLASDVDNSTSKISSSLGMTKKEAEELSKVSQALWKDGFGESLEEVDSALINVRQNMKGIKGDDELKKVTKDAMVLAQTFDADINEVTRAGNNLMTNFGISSEKAFDMMAHGAQNGLDFSKEMFDNLAEYSPLWATMGYDAEEMFGVLQRGSEKGVYNLDYLNDVMKEFQIRAKDGSKATRQAMDTLSPATQKIFEDFENGKVSVKDMASAVVGDLKGMDDQVFASQMGVALFGTKWEDLESEAIYAMLGTNDAMEGFQGAAKKAGDSLQDNFATKLSKTMRTAQHALLPVGIILLDLANKWLPKIAAVIEKVATAFAGLPTEMQGMIIGGAALLAVMGPLLVVFGTVISSLGSITGALGSTIKGFAKLSRMVTGTTGIFGGFSNAADSAGGAGGGGPGGGGPNPPPPAGQSKFKKVASAAVKGVSKVMKGIGGIIVKAGAMLLPLLANPVTLAVVAAVAIIAGGIYLIIKHWDKLKAGTIKVFKSIGDFLQKWGKSLLILIGGPIVWLVAYIKKNWDSISQSTTKFMNFMSSIFSKTWSAIKSVTESVFRAISSFLNSIWNSLKNFFTQILNTIKNTFTRVWNSIKSFLTSVMNSIKSTIQSVWNSIKSTISTVLNAIKSIVTSVWNSIKSTISSAMRSIKSTIVSAWNSIKSSISGIVTAIKNTVSTAFNAMKNTASSVARTLKSVLIGAFNAIKSGASSAFSGISRIISNAFSGMKSIAKNALSWGGDIVNGLVKGMTNKIKNVVGAAKKVANSVSKTVRNALGIKSPSRVMRGFGLNVGQGLAIGIEKTKGLIDRASAGMVAAINTPGILDLPVVAASLDTLSPIQALRDSRTAPQVTPGGDTNASTGNTDKGVIIQNAQFTIEVEKLQSAEDIQKMRKSIQNVVADDLFGMAVRNV